MSWLVLILAATNLFAVSNLLDKFFCGKKFKNVYAFALTIYLLSAIPVSGLLFFVDFSWHFSWPFFWAVLSGPVYFIMWVLWWQALRGAEVSRAAVVFNTAPVFAAILAVIFLGESLVMAKWLGIFLIVGGAGLCSWENKGRGGFKKTYILVILAAIISAVGDVISKLAMKEFSGLAIYVISFYASLPLYGWLLRKEGVWLEVRENLGERKVLGGLFLRVLVAFAAICLFYLALEKGPVSLVIAVTGIGPLLVFLYATGLSFFRPKFIKEEIGKKALIWKGLAVALAVLGVVLVSL